MPATESKTLTSKYQPVVTVTHDAETKEVLRVEIDWAGCQLDVDPETGDWFGDWLPSDDEQVELSEKFDLWLADNDLKVFDSRPPTV